MAAVGEDVMRHALVLAWPDFEDAVCAAAAEAGGCDAIVTRDPRALSSACWSCKMTNMATSKKPRTRQYNIATAKAKLPSLVRETLAGDEVIIARDNKPLVKLVPVSPLRRKPGTAKGLVIYMSPDFDEPLEDFEDYM